MITDIELRKAGTILQHGGIVIYPTDTAYAIGCLYNNTKAIRTIMKIKGRTDPKFTVIASSLAQVEKYFSLNALQRRLARRYWPGALSIVVNKRYAVRVPQQVIARSLARRAGHPLLATSVNLSGQPALYDLRNLVETLHATSLPVDAIIDIGRLRYRKPSAIVECKDDQIIIHRHGPITIPGAKNA